MSKSEASTDKAEAAAPKKKKRSGKWLTTLFILLAMAFLRTGFVFLFIGLLPSIVISFLDRSPNRYMFKTVFCCNMSAMMAPIAKILQYGPKSSIIQEVMGNSMMWVFIYACAFGGLFLINIMPMIAQILVGGFHQTKIAQLISTQEKIESEWGQEVTQFSKPDEAR